MKVRTFNINCDSAKEHKILPHKLFVEIKNKNDIYNTVSKKTKIRFFTK